MTPDPIAEAREYRKYRRTQIAEMPRREIGWYLRHTADCVDHPLWWDGRVWRDEPDGQQVVVVLESTWTRLVPAPAAQPDLPLDVPNLVQTCGEFGLRDEVFGGSSTSRCGIPLVSPKE